MARRRREQFQFTVVELSALAVSFAVTSGLVFLLGVYVGRRTAAEHVPVGEQVARIPVGEPPLEGKPPDPKVMSRDAEATAESTGDVLGTRPERLSEQVSAAARVVVPTEDAPKQIPTAAVPSVPYTVQVLATRDREEANTLAAGLKKKGYGAYVAAVEDAGGSWYRVRIGHYDNAEAARRMADRCHGELGLTQAYVSPVYSDAR